MNTLMRTSVSIWAYADDRVSEITTNEILSRSVLHDV